MHMRTCRGKGLGGGRNIAGVTYREERLGG